MGDLRVPRAEDRLAPHRLVALLAALPLLLAACGSTAYTQVGFRNDLPRPVQVGLCKDATCRSVAWWIGVDRQAVATESIRSDGRTSRFLVVGPPDTVFGCLAFRFPRAEPDRTVRLSTARGCGSGR